MKKSKPMPGDAAVLYIDDNMYIDVEHLQEWKKQRPLNEYYYGGLVLGFGKTVFVFDVESCELFEGNKKEKRRDK